jgi:outer membrane protein TolC
MPGLRSFAVAIIAASLAAPSFGTTLQQAIDLALANNEQPAILAARHEAARARIDAARSRRLPQLNVGSGWTLRDEAPSSGGNRDALTAQARLDVPLFSPTTGALVRRARLLAEGAELDVKDERRLLIRDVTEAYLLTLSSDQVLQAARRRREYAESALGDARSRAEAGIASINDVTKVELERATAAREASAAQADREAARLLLENLMNAPATDPLDPPEALLRLASAPPPPQDDLERLARDRRLDLQSRKKLAEAWNAYAEEPLRRFLPTVGATGIDDVDVRARDASDREDWSVGLGVSWNPWDSGLRAADRRERLALAGEADLQVTALERAAIHDVRLARSAMVAAQASVVDATAAVDAARRNAEETAELYRQGLRTALEVADAGNRAFDADVSLTRERLDLALAWVDLLAAIGSDPTRPEALP